MTKIRQIFFDETNILRSGWRVFFFLFLFIFLMVFLSSAAMIFLPSLMAPDPGYAMASLLLNAAIMFVSAFTAGYVCVRNLEGLSAGSLGLTFKGRWPFYLLFGIIVGAATVSLAAGLAYILAGTEFVFSNFASSEILRSLALSGFIFLIAAAAEELVFRGYIFQTLVRSNHTVAAFLLTSTLFAMVHQGNPGANIIGWANTFLAGIWFGIAYLKTKELWFVSGIHFAWNWLQGSLYGIEVSGLTEISPHPVLKELETGPAWIGGGSYGLEGGIVTTISILISIIAINYLTSERFDKTKRAVERY